MTYVTIANVTMSLEAARSVEWAGVDVAADVARVRREGNCDGLLAECLDGAEPEHEGDWRDYVSAVCAAAERAEQAPACESGTATGEPCAWDGEADDLVTVEWMPEHLRSSHEAAGNWGTYPYNGAERLRCCPACAEMLQAEQAEQDEATIRHARHAAVGDTIGGSDGNAYRIVRFVSVDRAIVTLGDWDDVADDVADGGCTPRVMVEASS